MSARYCQCGAVVRYGQACPRCRPTTRERGYDWQWQQMRLAVLEDEPLCRKCDEGGRATPAVHVHHIVPIATSRALRLVRSNLMPLCEACHSEIHGGETWRASILQK